MLAFNLKPDKVSNPLLLVESVVEIDQNVLNRLQHVLLDHSSFRVSN